jgi:hypothetical protein
MLLGATLLDAYIEVAGWLGSTSQQVGMRYLALVVVVVVIN